MTKQEIADWKSMIGKKAILPGNIGFYEYIRVALCATKNTSTRQRPVLFVLNCFNEHNYPGFRLNNEKYSCYPDEREVLLAGGESLEIEFVERIEAKNMVLHKDQPDINEQTLTIIYLLKFG